MEELHETKYVITVKTKKQLTEEEIWEAVNDFKWRLQGYTTECPESLIGSGMEIKYIKE